MKDRINSDIVGYMKLDFLFFFFSFSRGYVIGEKEIYIKKGEWGLKVSRTVVEASHDFQGIFISVFLDYASL